MMSATDGVSKAFMRNVREQALAALSIDNEERIAKYFRIDSNFAGSLFLAIEPNEPDRFTVADLFAASTLKVSIPVRATRRFLVETAVQDTLTEGLRALPDGPIEKAEDADLQAMFEFYQTVKSALMRHCAKRSNAWVTASKLVARKRPHLFPVRDRKVIDYLGLGQVRTVVQEYSIFRHLMSDPDVQERLSELQEHLESRKENDKLLLEDAPLRLLDVALWRAAG